MTTVKELRELLKSIPSWADDIELEYEVKYSANRDLGPGEYDSYEGMPTGDTAIVNVTWHPGDRKMHRPPEFRAEHW